MRRNTIGMIWIGGLVLAALLYVAGPDRFLNRCLDVLDAMNEAVHAIVVSLGAQANDVVHALALALLVVFVVLGLLASRRGVRAGWAMVVVPVAFLMLVWRPFSYGPAPIGRWLAALVLALVGAVAMTRRLIDPPPQSGPWLPPRWPADRS
ncbi:MAG: hypothetical protein P4L71_14355 [Acetobacteraceae bacterium]|nr:hypothetical protein [Acetobacteraceae bacterium]